MRRHPVLRESLAEVLLLPQHIVCPIFVSAQVSPVPVPSLPGIFQETVESALDRLRQLNARGVNKFLIFGVTEVIHKDDTGSYAAHPQAPVNRLMQAVRAANLPVLLIADLCLCEYTNHGHCGMLCPGVTGDASLAGGGTVDVDNDATLITLGKTAVAQARAGADMVAPSGMMDGQVTAIRAALDDAGFPDTAILAYSIKYASQFYGPFREAGGGGMAFGDRSGYQMDPRRAREWRTELDADIAQGADLVMVKPALPYLDILYQVRQACSLPVVAYHTSGEYAMLHAAAERGWVDLEAGAMEQLLAVRRAGADWIITYFAQTMLNWRAMAPTQAISPSSPPPQSPPRD